EREKEFVTAAKAVGIRENKIIFRHILPNVISVVIVNVTLSYATSLLTESSLSFLGFGVVEPSPTWGNMLTGSQNASVIANYWWRWVFPALALSASTISINLLGDGLRDAIDPKSEER
ncbi:MAG: ABC transporter permease, partial [Clostridia bacterium]